MAHEAVEICSVGASPVRPPAILYCEQGPDAPAVAALTVLDRILVAVARAGCQPIYVVSSGPLPRLRRARALGIPFQVVATAPALNQPVLVASDRWLVTLTDMRRVLDERGRLTVEGRGIPVGWAARSTGAPEQDLAETPGLAPAGVVAPVHDGASARAAAGRLWASMRSASDGTVDRYFNRPVGRRLFSKALLHTPVTPNQVSVVATLLGLGSAVLFAQGTTGTAIAGALMLQLSAIVDCVDGDLARMGFKESPLGKWLDLVGDQVVHIGVFVALGVGLWRAGLDAPVLALATSAGVGVVLSFLVILRTLLNPAPAGNSSLQKLIDATTNRDFSVLLLALALVDRLVWFLWLAGIGVHVFWITALTLQQRGARAARA